MQSLKYLRHLVAKIRKPEFVNKILLFSESFENCWVEIITFFSHKKVILATKRLFESQKCCLNHNTNSINFLVFKIFTFRGLCTQFSVHKFSVLICSFFYYFFNYKIKKNIELLIRGKPNIKKLILILIYCKLKAIWENI